MVDIADYKRMEAVSENEDADKEDARPTSTASRIPSLTSAKAVFSRPVTAVPSEEQAAVLSENVKDETGEEQTTPMMQSPVLETGDTEGQEYNQVLITEYKPDGIEEDAELAPQVQVQEERATPSPADKLDFTHSTRMEVEKHSIDIFIDADWDTDFDSEEESTDDEEDEEPEICKLYEQICKKLGVVPTSYFMRHAEDQMVNIRYHGLGSLGTQAMAKALKATLNIQVLDLQGNCMREKGCEHLCAVLEENHTIVELNLSENSLGNNAAEMITRMLSFNGTLRSLSLAANAFDDKVAQLFAECLEDSKLKDLDLSKNRFTDIGGQVLGPAIGANIYLDTLNLSWNKIRLHGAVAVAKGLKENARLRVCDLSWNGFGEEGGLALADVLLVNTSLKELDVSCNRLNASVAMRLAKALTTNETLELLALRSNPLTTAGCLALVGALNGSMASSLVVLDLADNPVECEFLKIVRQLETKRAIRITHGATLRSGNTAQDLGKRGMSPIVPIRKPIIIIEQQLVIHDRKKLSSLLAKHSSNLGDSCPPEVLMACIRDLDTSLSDRTVLEAVDRLPRNDRNRILLRDILR